MKTNMVIGGVILAAIIYFAIAYNRRMKAFTANTKKDVSINPYNPPGSAATQQPVTPIAAPAMVKVDEYVPVSVNPYNPPE